MDYVISPAGTLVHAREDWPCVVCRPSGRTGIPGALLCVDCAHELVSSAVFAMGVAGTTLRGDGWSALTDIANALAEIQGHSFNSCPAAVD